MNTKNTTPQKAKMLASLVEGTANSSSAMATVQRSHRFPLHILTQIENMAKIANVPVSMIINELLECGLESVKSELSEGVRKQVTIITPAQLDRPTKSTLTESTKRKTKKETSKE